MAEKLRPPLLRLTLLTANPIYPALLNSFLDINSSQIAQLPQQQQQQQPKQSSPTELAWQPSGQTESQSQAKLTGSLLASTSKPVILSSQLPAWGKKSSPGSSNNNSPSSSAGDAGNLNLLAYYNWPSLTFIFVQF